MRIREILGIIGEEILKIRVVCISLFNAETTQSKLWLFQIVGNYVWHLTFAYNIRICEVT